MALYEITGPDGAVYEINAPDDASQDQILTYAKSQFAKNSDTQKKQSVSGALAEAGKGFLRGASDVASLVPQGLAAAAGPAGQLIAYGAEAISAPSRSFVKADPAGPIERAAGTAAEIAGGVVAGGGVAGGAKAVARTAAPIVAAGTAGEAIGGDVGRFAGTVAGSVFPGAIARTAKNYLAKKVSPEVIESFRKAGITPSLGQATGLQWVQGLENLASKFPGGSGVMARFIENQQKRLGEKMRTGYTADQAGEAIQKGTENWLKQSSKKQSALEDEFGRNMNSMFFQRATSTEKALNEMLDPVKFQGSPAAMAQAEKEAGSMMAWLADIKAGKTMPFETVRKIRSRIGEMHTEELVHGRSGAAVDRVYAAMTDDLTRMADEQGFGAAWKTVNKHWSDRQDKVRNLLQPLLGKPGAKTPEDIFRAFMPTNRDQSTKVRRVMELLKPEERQVITRTVVDKLGKATPGKQGEFGEMFSSETFLTNWNKLSKSAKEMLFSDPEVRSKVNAIAHAADRIRKGGKVFSNPSGTAGSFAAYSVYTAPMGALALLAAGQPAAAGAVAGSAALASGSAYLGARMLTSPKVVKWLATRVNPANPRQMAAHLAALSTIREQSDDPLLKDEIEQFVSSAGK